MSFDQVSLWCLIGSAPWDPQEVRPILAAFVQADPDDRASRLALAEAYGSLGQYENVEAVLKHLPATDPGARAILARIAYDRGDPAAVEALLATGPDDHPILQHYRGQMALLHRDLPAAIRHFRRWTAADPHDRARLYMLGDALVKSGKPVEGDRLFAGRPRPSGSLQTHRARVNRGRTKEFGPSQRPRRRLPARRPHPRSQGVVQTRPRSRPDRPGRSSGSCTTSAAASRTEERQRVKRSVPAKRTVPSVHRVSENDAGDGGVITDPGNIFVLEQAAS